VKPGSAGADPGRPTPLVTLSTDIGWEYAAQMKAVLARGLPPGHVVDLSHELRPHAVAEAAFLLRHMAGNYPPGSVHVAVIDPGVGGPRAPIAIACRDGSILLGPDNGVLWPLARALGVDRAVRLQPARLPVRRPMSPTFEGRDLFSSAAVALAGGIPLLRLGTPHRPTPLELARPRKTRGSLVGELAYIDRFGNLITNIPSSWLPLSRSVAEVTLSRRAPRRLRRVRTYSDLADDELGVLGSSFGLLEVAQREGSAAERFGAATGERVEIRRPAPALPARVK